MSDYGLSDVVKYLLYVNGGKVEGIKKLVKLLFLIQYERCMPKVPVRSKCIKKYMHGGKPITRTEFYIWSYGPFTNKIYDVLDELYIEENGPTVVIGLPEDVNVNEIERSLPDEVKKRIDEVVKKYGKKKGYELEVETLKILDLKESPKKDYYKGYDVDEYLRVEGIRLKEEDLASKRGDRRSLLRAF